MLLLSGAYPKRGAWNVALFFSEVGSRSKLAKKNLARPSLPGSVVTHNTQSSKLCSPKAQARQQFLSPCSLLVNAYFRCNILQKARRLHFRVLTLVVGVLDPSVVVRAYWLGYEGRGATPASSPTEGLD